MPRDYRPQENAKRIKDRRDRALARREILDPTAPRTFSKGLGPVSMAIKSVDPEVQRMIEDFERRRNP